MKRRGFLKGLLAAPFVAKAILSEEPKEVKAKNVDYTPEIKDASGRTKSGVVRDILDTQKIYNARESAYLMGKGAMSKWEPEQLNFTNYSLNKKTEGPGCFFHNFKGDTHVL